MKTRGQSLVEFAIALPMLLILLLGTLDVGRMYFTWLALQNAAGEGALYAAINLNCIWPDDEPACSKSNRNAYERAISESPSGLVDWERITKDDFIVEPADRFGMTWGDPITITIYYDYDILTPVVAPLFPDGKLRLKARAMQKMIDYCLGGRIDEATRRCLDW